MQNKRLRPITGLIKESVLQSAKDLVAHGFTVLVGVRTLERARLPAKRVGLTPRQRIINYPCSMGQSPSAYVRGRVQTKAVGRNLELKAIMLALCLCLTHALPGVDVTVGLRSPPGVSHPQGSWPAYDGSSQCAISNTSKAPGMSVGSTA